MRTCWRRTRKLAWVVLRCSADALRERRVKEDRGKHDRLTRSCSLIVSDRLSIILPTSSVAASARGCRQLTKVSPLYGTPYAAAGYAASTSKSEQGQSGLTFSTSFPPPSFASASAVALPVDGADGCMVAAARATEDAGGGAGREEAGEDVGCARAAVALLEGTDGAS